MVAGAAFFHFFFLLVTLFSSSSQWNGADKGASGLCICFAGSSASVCGYLTYYRMDVKQGGTSVRLRGVTAGQSLGGGVERGGSLYAPWENTCSSPRQASDVTHIQTHTPVESVSWEEGGSTHLSILPPPASGSDWCFRDDLCSWSSSETAAITVQAPGRPGGNQLALGRSHKALESE